MPKEFKLKIVEGRTASDLEQKVETFLQEAGAEISKSHYQRTTRNYLAFIEYVSKSRLVVPVELSTSTSVENFKKFKERVIDQAERTYLQTVLSEYHGNISKASVAAGLSRYHFRNLLKKYDLHQPTEKKEEE